MATPLQTLTRQHDLRTLVENDLGAPHRRGGRARLWPCPLHAEQHGYSLAVWADGFCCFGACQRQGDALDWLQAYRHLSLAEAVAVLEQALPTSTQPIQDFPRRGGEVPPELWQAQVGELMGLAQETLWSEEGEGARDYLRQRGLQTDTLRRAGIGLVTTQKQGWQRWRISLPLGITIPWWADDQLWAVKVRRASGQPKYLAVTGSSTSGLYNADALSPTRPVLICEGEFDALLAQQAAGDQIIAVTLASASASLLLRWQERLSTAPRVLICYDNDTAGRKGAERLQRSLPFARRVSLPHGKDLTEFHLNGGDLAGWIAVSLEEQQ